MTHLAMVQHQACSRGSLQRVKPMARVSTLLTSGWFSKSFAFPVKASDVLRRLRSQTIGLLALVVAWASAAWAVGPPKPCGPIPNERQIEWYHREIIAFFHFGINTFGENVNEGDGKAPATVFN